MLARLAVSPLAARAPSTRTLATWTFVAWAMAAPLLLAGQPARAQEVDRIAAVVNDDVITNRDLEDRTRLALALSHLPDSIEARRRVVPQVLRKMIDEHLELQEAKRLKISLTDKEISEGVAMIEQQNGMPPGGMEKQFAGAGLDFHLIRQQIAADLTWMRVATAMMRQSVHVSDEEINDRLEIIKAHRGQPEYLAAEIFLPVDNPGQDEQAHTLGTRLIEQLRQGVPFPVLAGQFSQAPTAANGGSLGWVSQGSIDDDLLKALSTLPPGQVSSLIRIDDGYHILALIKRRIAGSGDESQATVSLAQMILPMPPDGKISQEALVARAKQITQGSPSCQAFQDTGRKVGAVKVGPVGPVAQSHLPPPVQQVIGPLTPGQVSQPLAVPGGLEVLMLCSRSDVGLSPLPSREQVRAAIESERLDVLTQRYLRDLRRAAFVDIRM